MDWYAASWRPLGSGKQGAQAVSLQPKQTTVQAMEITISVLLFSIPAVLAGGGESLQLELPADPRSKAHGPAPPPHTNVSRHQQTYWGAPAPCGTGGSAVAQNTAKAKKKAVKRAMAQEMKATKKADGLQKAV